jgi:hypothetical protein
MVEANARTSDPETSHDAARTFSQRVRARVEHIFAGRGQALSTGLTDEELERVYLSAYGDQTRRDSPRKRRSDLVRDGVLRDTGIRRPSSTGRMMIVWAEIQ